MGVEELSDEEDDVSDDDIAEKVEDSSFFSMGMSKHEKVEAMRPWKTALIIKLVRRKIGYQYLLSWL